MYTTQYRIKKKTQPFGLDDFEIATELFLSRKNVHTLTKLEVFSKAVGCMMKTNLPKCPKISSQCRDKQVFQKENYKVRNHFENAHTFVPVHGRRSLAVFSNVVFFKSALCMQSRLF